MAQNATTLDNFWQTIPKPIIGLSPMDGVSDHPFRHIQKKYGKPSVVYTEFTNVEGLCHNATQLLKDFLYDETQRPIVGQIYGTTPEYFRQVAVLLCQLGFDGIDINMGCPAKNVESSGAGAALIKNPELAERIIVATKAGVTDFYNGATVLDCPDISPAICAEVARRASELPQTTQQRRMVPVSIKTRVGYDKPVVEEWIPTLLKHNPACIALHGRTLKQQYGGSADWDEIQKAATLCHNHGDTIILGNGDIDTLETAHTRIKNTGVDGVLIGRASMGNPYVFLEQLPTSPSIFEIALEHCHLFEATYAQDPRYSFLPMRKHLGWYVKHVVGAKEVRIALFQANSAAEVAAIFKSYHLV